MSSSSFWFAPDAEYYAATEDYAIVNESASWVRRGLYEEELFLHDDDENSNDGENDLGKECKLTLRDVLTDPIAYGNCLGLRTDTQLLYADVDSNDPSHLEINKRVAKEGFLEEESDRSKKTKENLIDHLVSLSHKPLDSYDSDYGDIDDVDEVDDPDEAKAKRERILRALERTHGLVSPRKVDYILSLEDEGDRREVLNICSNQAIRKLQRPVILLVGMVEEPSAEESKTKKGWAIVYNLYNNRITVKPFLSDETHHPLAEKWDADLPDDGISLTGHPSAFVEKILQLQAEIESKKHEEDPLTYASRILVYYLIAKWLVRHWKALTGIKQADDVAAMTDEGLEKVNEAKGIMLAKSARIELPSKKQQPTAKKAIRSFGFLLSDLEDYEMTIRSEAVKAKEAGNEAAAENAAKLYDQLREQLQAFNMDPEKEL
ncbi:MAG: hypothetical protein Q9225_004149 [Loekoesia sp. 1 TL-2023]